MACANCGSASKLDVWKYESDDGDYASFGASGPWAIIRPPLVAVKNLITNPSFEANANSWSASLGSATISNDTSYSGAYSLKLSSATGGAVGCYYNAGLTLDALGNLCAAVRIKTCVGSTVELRIGNTAHAGTPSQSGGIETYTVTTDGWAEYTICCRSLISTAATGDFEIAITPGAGCGTPFVAYIDAAIVTATDTPSSYFDGDTGGSWDGTPDNSTSTVSAHTRLYGEPVFLGDLGLTLLGDDGSGMPPVERTVEAYARRPGGAQTGTHWGSRTIRLTLGIEGSSWKEVAAIRKKLIDLLALDPMARCNSNELLLRRYCVDDCGEPDLTRYYELVVNYNGGLQATRAGIFKEKVVLELVADQDPLYSSPEDYCTPLTPNVAKTINNPTSISVPVEIFIRNNGAVTIEKITNVTTGAVIRFGTAAGGAGMNFGATWKFSNRPGEFGVTEQLSGVASDETGQLTMSGANPGSFFLAPGDNKILAELSVTSGTQITICYKKSYMSADSVCGGESC